MGHWWYVDPPCVAISELYAHLQISPTNIEDWSSIPPTLFPFDQLKNLASLAISQTTTEDYVDHDAGFNNLVNITMILRSPTPSSLKKISLSFQCRETPSDFNLNIMEWNEMDKALTRSQYCSVTEIYIRLDVDLECVEGHDINIDDFVRDHHNLFEQSLMPLTFISFQDAEKGKNITFEVFTTVTQKRTSLSWANTTSDSSVLKHHHELIFAAVTVRSLSSGLTYHLAE